MRADRLPSGTLKLTAEEPDKDPVTLRELLGPLFIFKLFNTSSVISDGYPPLPDPLNAFSRLSLAYGLIPYPVLGPGF